MTSQYMLSLTWLIGCQYQCAHATDCHKLSYGLDIIGAAMRYLDSLASNHLEPTHGHVWQIKPRHHYDQLRGSACAYGIIQNGFYGKMEQIGSQPLPTIETNAPLVWLYRSQPITL